MGDDDVDGEEAVRRLVGSWLGGSWRGGEPLRAQAAPEGASLQVPPAAADDVIPVARRLAGDEREDGSRPVPPFALRLIAEVMVLDEHPSARGWTAAEREDALIWIALVIHRFGEDGVQRLIAELNARS